MLRTSSLAVCLALFLLGVPARGGEPASPSQGIENLIRQLRDPDATMITLAAYKLIELSRDPKTSPKIVKKIRNEIREHFHPRNGPKATKIALFKALVKKREKFFNPDIVSFACNSDPPLFEPAVDALKKMIKIGDETIPDRFITIFRNSENPVSVRVRAIRALNHLGAFKAIPHLIESRGQAQPEIALAAQQSLEGISGFPWAKDAAGWGTWWDANREKEEIDLLRLALGRLHKEALRLLDPKSTAANIKASTSGIKSVRVKALQNLAQLRDPASIDALLNFIQSELYADLRVMAIPILGDLAKTDGALKDGKHVKIAKSVVDTLRKETNVRMLKVKVEVLGKIGHVKGLNLIDPLVPFLKSKDGEVRALTAYALGKIDGEEAQGAVKPLSVMLLNQDEGANGRRNAANALGQIRDSRALPALIRVLSDPDVNLRWSCANSLGNIGDEKSVEALIKRLPAEKENRVLEVLVKALHNIRCALAVEELARLALKKPDLAEKALEAILFIGEAHGDSMLKAVDVLEKEDEIKPAIRILRTHLSKIQGPATALRSRLAGLLEKDGAFGEAAGEYLTLLENRPKAKEGLDKLLGALGRIVDPAERGRITAIAVARIPNRSREFFGGPVRDMTGKLKGREGDFVDGLVKGWEEEKPDGAFFDGLLSFLVDPDGKAAAAAHLLLVTLTGRKVAPLPENAANGVKAKALTGWKRWLEANMGKLPFRKK